MFKDWGYPLDSRKNDLFQGDSKSSYNTIEAFETRDGLSYIDLIRPVRNTFEDVKDLQWFDQASTAIEMGNEAGVLKHSINWAFSGDTNDIMTIKVNPGTGDTYRYFSRLKPGIAFINGNIIVSRPQTWVAERQIAKILQLNDWKDESVSIKYFQNTDLFQAKVVQRDYSGIPQPFYFNNQLTVGTGASPTVVTGDSLKWGDSRYGYRGAIAMFGAMHRTWPVLFRLALADSVYRIFCEPYYKLPTKWFGDTIYWKINAQGIVYGDSKPPLPAELPLQAYRFQVIGQLASYVGGSRGDSRRLIQNVQDFPTNIYLNTSPYFGDTSSYSDSMPWSDSQGYKFVTVANRNAGLVVYNQLAGKNNSGTFFYMKDAVPGVLPSRSGVWWANKDIIAGRWVNAGDTLGRAWASVMSMSGDSWTFWGDKTFQYGSVYPMEATGHFLGRNTNKWEMIADSLSAARVSASGIITADSFYATRTIMANGLVTGDSVYAIKNITTAGLITGDSVYTTRTIMANGLVTGDSLYAIKNITTAGLVTGDSLYATRTIMANGLVTGDSVYAIKNITTAGLVTADSFYATRTIMANGLVTADSLYAIRNIKGANGTFTVLVNADSLLATRSVTGAYVDGYHTLLSAGSPYTLVAYSTGKLIVNSTADSYVVNLPQVFTCIGYRVKIINGSKLSTGLIRIQPYSGDAIGNIGIDVPCYLQNVDQSGNVYYFQSLDLVATQIVGGSTGAWAVVAGQLCPQINSGITSDPDGSQYYFGRLHHLPTGNSITRLIYSGVLPSVLNFSTFYYATGNTGGAGGVGIGVPLGAKGIRARVQVQGYAFAGSQNCSLQVAFSDNNTSTPTLNTAHPQAGCYYYAIGPGLPSVYSPPIEVDIPLTSSGSFYIYTIQRNNATETSSNITIDAVGYYMGD